MLNPAIDAIIIAGGTATASWLAVVVAKHFSRRIADGIKHMIIDVLATDFKPYPYIREEIENAVHEANLSSVSLWSSVYDLEARVDKLEGFERDYRNRQR